MNSMRIRTNNRGLALFLAFVVPLLSLPSIGAADGFAVESFTKYDREATSYMAPSSANFAVVKKGSADFVIWTRGELTADQLTVIESYARHQDPSLQDRNAIFLSGMGDHYVDTMYGTITFENGDYGLVVTMPRQW